MDRPFRFTPLVLSVIFSGLLAFAGDSGAATYFGLVHGTTYDQTGYVRVVLGKSGVGTVAVKLGDQSTCVVMIGPGGTTSGGPTSIGGVFFPIKPNPPMQVKLSLVTLPHGGTALSGTIVDDWGDILNITLPNAAPSADSSTLAGRYTLVLETPSAGSAFSNDIAGFGTLRVFKTGHFIFHGTLSDGSSVHQLGTLNSSGNWEMLAKSHGRTLSGEVDFADETETDFTGDLELAGPGKNGGPETDVSMQLVGSFYDPKLEWNAEAAWNISSSDDSGATIAFSSDLSAKSDLLYGGGVSGLTGGVPSVFSLLSSGGKLASVFLEQDTGAVVGGYAKSLTDIRGLMGVAFQKTSGAFGLTMSIGRIPSLSAKSTINSLKNEILPILRSLKPKPSGIFSVETTSNTPGSSGFSAETLQTGGGSSVTTVYVSGSSGATLSFSIGGSSDSGTISPAGSSSDGVVVSGLGSFGSIDSGGISISNLGGFSLSPYDLATPMDGNLTTGILVGGSPLTLMLRNSSDAEGGLGLRFLGGSE